MAEVVVTGFGVRTAFGRGADAIRRGVFGGVPSFAPTTRFDTGPYRTPNAATTGSDKPDSQRDVLGDCADEAVEMAGFTARDDTAVLVGTSGDFATLTRFWRGEAGVDVADTVPAHLVDLLAARIGAAGQRLAFTNACVASASAIIHACGLIASGRLESAVCGGAYLVEEEVFAKFDSGRALSRDGVVRPFSVDRSGMLLGDGAAVVVLESASAARRRGARPLATVAGWGAASDAFHVSRPHPQGAGLAAAAQRALRRAGDPDGLLVDYVNAHGTATKFNDPAETQGLHEVFGTRADQVPVSSTKSTTGHLLEAAGIVEFVITLLALTDGVLPPTANFTEADPSCDLDYVPNTARDADVRRALNVNAAFGGFNTALVLERP
ncbi:beta-ketoacyl-[acyl-carrier-protein] synthase family protein [Umezawaea endophytica]|uniref:Beta-ketoacyl-[acyl-carrier-protein] synthase family protein n=1 Tax=Umezawaea endophytica TaxID=1654476 RepID=A0A9X3AI14_9PSEU|nr:beta-ketoacyl-[acyl-carrier-protein] synthase family protein [Umezawaea endophytica]MCS7480015.1 beta-ketoacyl-[acyl-carrier-protein] synthase family protein [Umezawaea endophytica]